MLKSSLCDYSDAYIFVKVTITAVGAQADNAARATDGNSCAQFTDCITEINSTIR